MVSSRQQRRLDAQRKIIQHFEEQLPHFTDVFDERSFYIFAGCVIAASIVLVIVLSYFCNVTIQDAEEIAREKERRKRQKQQKLVESLLRKKLAKAGFDENGVDFKKTEELKKMLERLSKQAVGRSEESELDDEVNEEEEDDELLGEHRQAAKRDNSEEDSSSQQPAESNATKESTTSTHPSTTANTIATI